jgi:hypothetical protein
MPISVQSIVERMNASLDAEGSDRYLFDQDFKPAINSAIEWAVSVFNAAFAEKKISPEQLKELVKVKVWQTSAYSRVSYDPAAVGHNFWTIIAVYPQIKTNRPTSILQSTDPSKSFFRPNMSFIESGKSAKRLTLEEWNINRNNPFKPGNVLISSQGLLEYGYLDFADYTSTTYNGNAVPFEIEIRPSVPKQLIGMAYLKVPTLISTINDSVEFPDSLRNVITECALNYVATKQGDGTTLWGITEKDVDKLVGLMI